ncbi:hypothetical protein [Xanthocytophaga flava]|uniref:hypothetical protein n=1 Tax=Xanthocytophaga flava TaxID=3048013 RepID=UPI0028D59795|nr:hypothetical protein [Xanthocytophaga flavus]MDJ1472883.1 hypothetical protein [Xanthocytophaga flavus]
MTSVFNLLSDDFEYIRTQIADGIITGFQKRDTPFKNYTKFTYNSDVLNLYENPSGSFFSIKGIFVYDLQTMQFVEIHVHIVYGLLLGYSIPAFNTILPDCDRITIESFQIEYAENEDFLEIKPLLNDLELQIVNPSNVYIVEIRDKVYYHILDLEDGDSIGIDKQKIVYKITHDPFDAIKLTEDLSVFLK